MNSRLILVLALIVVAPLVIAGWLGARAVRNEQAAVEQRFRELTAGRLSDVDRDLRAALDAFAVSVLAEAQSAGGRAADLRRLTLESPYAVQQYRIDRNGRLLFPPVFDEAQLPSDERDALMRTREVWESGAIVAVAHRTGEAVAASSSLSSADGSGNPSAGFGWHTWYWGNGMQWMLWFHDGDTIRVAEINRARLLAGLVAALPETDADAPALVEGRIDLVDPSGTSLYRWGALDVEDDTSPLSAHALAAPLGAWTLEYRSFGRPFGDVLVGGVLLNLVAGLLLLAVVVGGLVTYVYHEQKRALLVAAQRVTFVNQVSHELKTPLTNIRMYAELLEEDLDETGPRTRQQLGVIVAESQRLSRLIGNVLTFGREQRGALTLQRRPAVVDEVVRNVLAHFGPSLDALGIRVGFAPAAGETASFDPDALEQIVGNLVSNVEKYAASGQQLDIATERMGNHVEITIADRGPGLNSSERGRIFEPFYRVGNALTEGTAGTGIGLSIARELARLHGGELELEPSDRGARFRLTFDCPVVAT